MFCTTSATTSTRPRPHRALRYHFPSSPFPFGRRRRRRPALVPSVRCRPVSLRVRRRRRRAVLGPRCRSGRRSGLLRVRSRPRPPRRNHRPRRGAALFAVTATILTSLLLAPVPDSNRLKPGVLAPFLSRRSFIDGQSLLALGHRGPEGTQVYRKPAATSARLPQHPQTEDPRRPTLHNVTQNYVVLPLAVRKRPTQSCCSLL